MSDVYKKLLCKVLWVKNKKGKHGYWCLSVRFRSKFELDVWSWTLKLNFEFELRKGSLKLDFDAIVWSLSLKF